MSIWSFEDGGKTLAIFTPNTPSPWKNMLFNDEYLLDLTQRMQGAGVLISPVFKTSEYILEQREIYVRADGRPHRLLCGEGKDYVCRQRLESSETEETFDAFRAGVRAFVPVRGRAEIWTVSVENLSGAPLSGEVTVCFHLGKAGTMGQCARYDAATGSAYRAGFPYYVYYDEYEAAKKKQDICFVTADRMPDSYECNTLRFHGADNPFAIPRGVAEGRLACGESDDGATCGALQFCFRLAPGERFEVNLAAGVCPSAADIPVLKARLLQTEERLAEVRALWEERMESFTAKTPDENLNALLNVWLKKQALFLGRMNRASTYCPIRNQLQDAMGYALVDPDDAFRVACNVLSKQYKNGYIKGWVMTDGSAPQKLCLIEHSDGPIWLLLCLVNIIEMCGRPEYYDKQIPYGDCGETGTVREHLRAAALYMAGKTGAHGMCLMLDGDWTDPLNGPGRLGRGESCWNTAALVYAIRRFTAVIPDAELTAAADRLDAAMNEHGWDGNWYYAGIDDSGRPYGRAEDAEARIFLNAQSFAVMAGIARGDRLEKVLAAMETLRIGTGYLLFAPEFRAYNPVWGRISAKNPGTAENGCAYCHGTMFKAGADAAVGNADRAYATLYSVLPVNPDNPPENNAQSPTFIPNFYFSLPGENLGRSSFSYGTGSVAWFLWLMVEYVLGVRNTSRGQFFEPHLPAVWKDVTVSRRFRGESRTYTAK